MKAALEWYSSMPYAGRTENRRARKMGSMRIRAVLRIALFVILTGTLTDIAHAENCEKTIWTASFTLRAHGSCGFQNYSKSYFERQRQCVSKERDEARVNFLINDAERVFDDLGRGLGMKPACDLVLNGFPEILKPKKP
ncbi:hypothetical protein [Microvirga arsenatis]|uniref:Uncharacterized protein n=1 Tax=Microvirga arsenatis TaxID=2692265 RepID=A0ABW9Z389_9HYPH|nr:hypothetical protein [Microvirga arsenatis]NBJ13699.1 hypothetical protein [Microvirga arsenatis]NBJ27151.1 hypothetical protein [Microvirga arsenatis]